jgi:hypothetical protein
VRDLKILYALTDDKREKAVIRLSLLNLGHRVKKDK